MHFVFSASVFIRFRLPPLAKADAQKRAEKYQIQYELKYCAGESSCVKTMKFSIWTASCLEMHKNQGKHISGTYLAPAEKYSPETVKKDYNVMDLIFQTALDNQLCSSNPMVNSIRLSKYEAVTENMLLPRLSTTWFIAWRKVTPMGWRS